MWMKLRDWWRGYTDADMESMQNKLQEEHEAGSVIPLTPQEYAAFRDLLGWEPYFFSQTKN